MEHQADCPAIPARMLNEYVYCPRLAYLEWVQGEFAHNEFTVDGKIKHRRVDREKGTVPEQPMDEEQIHARSVWLTSELLGLTARVDLVEGAGNAAIPVDYKRGKRPHVAAGVHKPERVQLCAQGLLLREHGFSCDHGFIYFVGSRERVRVDFDSELEERTKNALRELRNLADSKTIPPPLEDSPKCPRCSLIGICLPDEIHFLQEPHIQPRPITPASTAALPLYVQSPAALVRKKGECLVIEENREKIAEARLANTSQVVLFGRAILSTPALHECLARNIPVTHLSYGGWFMGHTIGTGHKNVELRTNQYKASFDPERCLSLARSLVAAKIANCRTLLRRNWRGDGDHEKAPPPLLSDLQSDIRHAMRATSLEELLGVEGSAAGRYFANFAAMLKQNTVFDDPFDFRKRNRRPPRDPVNALLSFAYAMLTREWTVTLSAVGFDPYRGFYHQPRFGRPALSLDLMEPFRPLIADSVVITVLNNREIRENDFLMRGGGCALKPGGRKRFIAAFDRRLEQEVTHPVFGYRISYRRVLEVQARLLGRYLAGEIPRYPQFLTR